MSRSPLRERPPLVGRRRGSSAAVIVAVTALGLAACGSDSKPQPSTPTTVVDGRQAPGPNGNNPGGQDAGTSVAPASPSAGTADTVEKIDDQSPGGGGGLPGGSGP